MKISFLFFFAAQLESCRAFSITTSRTSSTTTNSRVLLSAIIYGWDDDDTDELNTKTGTPTYETSSSDFFSSGACSMEGTAVADRLQDDPNRMGSLARLAAAFSPPERGIGLKDIEKVQVVCVGDTQIELEAILCESLGCVSLNIPIQFPKECGPDGTNYWLEGCVMKNIDDLDSIAQMTLLEKDRLAANADDANLDELALLNEKVDYPSWWIPPENNAQLVGECDSIRRLLNDDEFASSIVALAQDGLEHAAATSYSVPSYGGTVVKKAKVAAVGPAGICMKVGANVPGRVDLSYMDVVYPFGGEPLQDATALRAAVLGAVAAAEEKRPAHL